MISRTGTLKEIFRLTSNLVFQDQYLQFVISYSPSTFLYGFGESSSLVQDIQNNSTRSLWASDLPPFLYGQSLYGSHPFMMQVAKDGTASGFFLLNSNAIQLTKTSTWTAIQAVGGIIDLYFFSGPSPQDVITQYLTVIGFPTMVPYWSLGFHNCRWGYPNIDYVAEVVQNYSLASIPLETQWVDIDYMDSFLDFTTDPINFPENKFKAFLDKLHGNNQHLVPIVDPGIALKPDYPAYENAVDMNVFIKDLNGVEPYIGHVWPGKTAFPDWFSPNSSIYWENELSNFHKILEFDGIWIDMNEIANFCNEGGAGQICFNNPSIPCKFNQTLGVVCCLICNTTDHNNKFDFPPFVPAVAHGTLGLLEYFRNN